MQEVEVEGERGKGVVEIVGDAAGELAENLGALGLLNLFGEALLLGDVFQAEKDPAFAAVGNGRGRGEEDGVARGIAWLRDFEVELGSVGGAALAGIVEGIALAAAWTGAPRSWWIVFPMACGSSKANSSRARRLRRRHRAWRSRRIMAMGAPSWMACSSASLRARVRWAWRSQVTSVAAKSRPRCG